MPLTVGSRLGHYDVTALIGDLRQARVRRTALAAWARTTQESHQ